MATVPVGPGPHVWPHMPICLALALVCHRCPVGLSPNGTAGGPRPTEEPTQGRGGRCRWAVVARTGRQDTACWAGHLLMRGQWCLRILSARQASRHTGPGARPAAGGSPSAKQQGAVREGTCTTAAPHQLPWALCPFPPKTHRRYPLHQLPRPQSHPPAPRRLPALIVRPSATGWASSPPHSPLPGGKETVVSASTAVLPWALHTRSHSWTTSHRLSFYAHAPSQAAPSTGPGWAGGCCSQEPGLRL